MTFLCSDAILSVLEIVTSVSKKLVTSIFRAEIHLKHW